MKEMSESTITSNGLLSWLLDANRRQSSEHGKSNIG
jgi:hypothetical protein